MTRPLRGIAIVACAGLLYVAGTATGQQQKPAEAKQGAQPTEAKQGAEQAKEPEQLGPPKLDARAWILIDALDGEVLAAQEQDRELAIASATKLMTAYVALSALRPRQRVEVAPYKPSSQEESLLHLDAGEKLTARDLLYGMLLPSANDAALALAVGASGSEEKFVAEMNRTAGTLGLEHSRFTNPIGLDTGGNHSSAADLVALTDALMENPLFARIVDTERAKLRSGAVPREVMTRNTLLLEDPTMIGVKTGHTNLADYVLVGAARRNGATLLSVVLGAPSEKARDAETQELLEYGFSLYRARRPVNAGEELASPDLEYRDEQLSLVAKNAVPASIRPGQRLAVRVDAPDEVSGPVEQGETLGRVDVTVDGQVQGSSPLIAADSVAAASTFDKGLYYVKQPLALIPAGLLLLLIGFLLVRRSARRRGEDPLEELHDPEDPFDELQPSTAQQPPPPAGPPGAPVPPRPPADQRAGIRGPGQAGQAPPQRPRPPAQPGQPAPPRQPTRGPQPAPPQQQPARPQQPGAPQQPQRPRRPARPQPPPPGGQPAPPQQPPRPQQPGRPGPPAQPRQPAPPQRPAAPRPPGRPQQPPPRPPGPPPTPGQIEQPIPPPRRPRPPAQRPPETPPPDPYAPPDDPDKLEEPRRPKGSLFRRPRREKRKGPPERTPEERRRMHEERMRRRRQRGR